jgi:hypothetical protein
MYSRLIWIGLSLLLLASGQGVAETPAKAAIMSLTDGKLEGDGADLLRAALPDAQFILIGEDHGFADSPEIALALAREARTYDVMHHVIETGPRTDALLTGILEGGDEDDLAVFLTGRPLAMPFANMAEDARLADYFVDEAVTGSNPLWGVDQEFLGSTLIYLENLLAMAPSANAADLARARLDTERQAFATGNLGALFLMSGTPEDFAELHTAFSGNAEAEALIRELSESADIYALYGRGANYASNAERVALIRRQFLDAYRAAEGPAPRALFKMGASHLGLGTGSLNTFDLGSLTEGIAAANGLDVLRIVFIPLEGQQTKTNPAAEGTFETASYRSEDISALLTAAGISETSIPADRYAVIPLEDLRARLEQPGLRALTPENRFIVLGYDYLITTRGARPATPLAR